VCFLGGFSKVFLWNFHCYFVRKGYYVYHTFFFFFFNCFDVAGDGTSVHNLGTSQEEEEKVKTFKNLATFLVTCFSQTHCQM
jgi:hypothetical protein